MFEDDLGTARSHNILRSLVIYGILPKAAALRVRQALGLNWSERGASSPWWFEKEAENLKTSS